MEPSTGSIYRSPRERLQHNTKLSADKKLNGMQTGRNILLSSYIYKHFIVFMQQAMHCILRYFHNKLTSREFELLIKIVLTDILVNLFYYSRSTAITVPSFFNCLSRITICINCQVYNKPQFSWILSYFKFIWKIFWYLLLSDIMCFDFSKVRIYKFPKNSDFIQLSKHF